MCFPDGPPKGKIPPSDKINFLFKTGPTRSLVGLATLLLDRQPVLNKTIGLKAPGWTMIVLRRWCLTSHLLGQTTHRRSDNHRSIRAFNQLLNFVSNDMKKLGQVFCFFFLGSNPFFNGTNSARVSSKSGTSKLRALGKKAARESKSRSCVLLYSKSPFQ